MTAARREHPPHETRAVWGWALYDFANSPFTTVIVTFVYAAYFTQAIASDPLRGTVLWSRAVTLSAVAVAVLSPVLGSLADCSGLRKRYLALTTATCVGATTLLFFPQRGDTLVALAAFFVANTAFELAIVFYNALLPAVAPPERFGRVSGLGWGLGYLGGLLALGLSLALLRAPASALPAWIAGEANRVRATPWLVAAWYAVFALPVFLWVPERPPRGEGSWREALRRLARAGHDLRRLPPLAWLLAAHLLYNDALVTIFAFGGIYATGTFAFSIRELLAFGIALNVTAGLGAWGFGYLDDRVGGKRTVRIALGGLAAGTTLAIFAPDRAWFWVASLWIGIFVGPVQSASRSLMARFVPRDMENELFGFYQLSGKLTAFAGPLLLGILVQAFESQRAGLAVVLLLLGAGWALLARVDEPRGCTLAHAASSGR